MFILLLFLITLLSKRRNTCGRWISSVGHNWGWIFWGEYAYALADIQIDALPCIIKNVITCAFFDRRFSLTSLIHWYKNFLMCNRWVYESDTDLSTRIKRVLIWSHKSSSCTHWSSFPCLLLGPKEEGTKKKKSTFKPDIKMGTMMWLHFSLIDSIRKYFRENEVTILTFEHVPWDLVTI